MKRSLTVPVGDGSSEGTITFIGPDGVVNEVMEAAKLAAFQKVREIHGAEDLGEKSGDPVEVKKKPCGCGDKK